MRCVGEIDITRPRWSERPTTLVPVILGNVKNFEPGAGERRFEQGRQEAWAKEQELLERLRALPDGERKAERDQADDRPRPDLHRVPGVSEVRHRQPLLRLQAGLAGRGRAPRAGRRAPRAGTTSSTSRSRSSTTSCARTRWTTSSSPSARTRSGRIKRSRRPGCSRRMARSSPGRTDATTCRPARWSACRSPPGPSKGGPASSSTWRRPSSNRATSWSRPTRTPAGRPCSSRSRAW